MIQCNPTRIAILIGHKNLLFLEGIWANCYLIFMKWEGHVSIRIKYQVKSNTLIEDPYLLHAWESEGLHQGKLSMFLKENDDIQVSADPRYWLMNLCGNLLEWTQHSETFLWCTSISHKRVDEWLMTFSNNVHAMKTSTSQVFIIRGYTCMHFSFGVENIRSSLIPSLIKNKDLCTRCCSNIWYSSYFQEGSLLKAD